MKVKVFYTHKVTDRFDKDTFVGDFETLDDARIFWEALFNSHKLKVYQAIIIVSDNQYRPEDA